MTSSTEKGRLVAGLERLGRRAVVALAIRYVCAGGIIAVLVVEAVLFGFPSSPAPAVLLGGIVIAAAVAVVTAWFRAPAIRETALTVDRRLHLQDRLVSGYQYRDATDAFSRLVVRDALSHVDDIRPAVAFPLHIPGWVRIAAVVACAAPVVFVVARSAVPEFWQRALRGDSSAPDALSMPSSAENVGGISASPGEAGATGASRVPVAVPRSSASGDAGTQSEAARENLSSPPERARGAAFENPVANGAAGSTTAAGSSGRNENTLPGGPSEGAAGAQGTGALALRQTSQAGGLTGEPGGDRQDAEAQRATSPTGGDAYRSDWSNAQRAIAHEHIPSSLRDYVRQYFLAIRPAESQ